MEFPERDDLLYFKLVICPEQGFYRNGRFMASFRASPSYPPEPPKVKCDAITAYTKTGGFVFDFRKSPNYPHEPPKVKCVTMVYHPNTDLDGDVCLNISGEDRKHVLTVNTIVYISL
ncbi:hypothetical protein HPB50_000172 [Hyalomma asiaticum]|uniref:Uncharacterized protein n=1 Tax=Hyalomma asiaticum TaxID=266040 RepID=A0ACB7TA90_HYAAI|nr:hypothetical protein HPB50_000172 [Hyalomma asiaticum]